MSFADIAQLAVDACTETFGVAATYTPPGGGSAVPCTVIVDRPDVEIGLPQGRAVIEGLTLEVRKSEIAEPRKGGSIAIAAETLKILDDPQAKDSDRLVWTMRVR